MKASLCGMILLLWSLNVNAIDFTTSGDGKTYSFEALSALEGRRHLPEKRLLKQVTLDTMTDEERRMIELSEKSNNKN